MSKLNRFAGHTANSPQHVRDRLAIRMDEYN